MAKNQVPTVANETNETAVINETATVQTVKTLADLQAEFQQSVVELSKMDVSNAAEYANAVKTMMAKQLAVDTEVKRLQKLEQLAEIERMRAEKLQVLNDLLNLHSANEIAQTSSVATQEEKDAATAEFKLQYDKVANILLGGVKTVSVKTSPKSDGQTTERSSNLDAVLHPRIAEMVANGQTWKQIRDQFESEGEAKSSVWHSVNRYKIANGLS